ncbi:MAG: FHA domain-containing protein [Chloroflexi bacterium]|nr:FHA domain-containing protein [Chloroflexota bacterium]
MEYGTLRVTTPDGQIREYPVEAPAVTLGRSEGNGVVIDHVSVSRRHALLRVDDGKVTIEDLGSANGTFVGSQRVAPNTAAPIQEGQPLRVGDVEVKFYVPISAGGSGAGNFVVAGATTSGGDAQTTFSVSLASPNAPVAVGGTTTATVVVQNRGASVDQFTISVVDLPQAWVRISRPQLSLVSAAKDEVTIVIQPARAAESVAGEYAFSVAVVSRDTGKEVRVLGRCTVLPFEGVTLAVESKGGGDFGLVVQNLGNAAAAYTITAADDREMLAYKLEADVVELKAGEQRTVKLEVSPKKKPLFGNVEMLPFRVAVKPRGGVGTAQASGDGQIAISPPLRYWKWVVAAVVLLGVVGLGAWLIPKIDFGGGGTPATGVTPNASAPAGASATAAPSAAPAVLANGTNAVVINSPTGKCLGVRTDPSLSGARIAEICDGDKVKITSDKKEADGYIWWSIDKGGTVKGWSAEKKADGTGEPWLMFSP